MTLRKKGNGQKYSLENIFSTNMYCLNHFKPLNHSCFESPGTRANNSGYPTIKYGIRFQNEDPSGKYLIVYTNYQLLTKKSKSNKSHHMDDNGNNYAHLVIISLCYFKIWALLLESLNRQGSLIIALWIPFSGNQFCPQNLYPKTSEDGLCQLFQS